MIVYMVGARLAAAVEEAQRLGWHRIGAFRFATPNKHDVRVVSRISEMVPMSGETLLIKAPDYDDGPPESDPVNHRAWFGREGAVGQRAEFEAFVATGRGRWIAGDEDIPINRGIEYAGTVEPAGGAF